MAEPDPPGLRGHPYARLDRAGLPVGDLLVADHAASVIHRRNNNVQVHRDNIAAVLAGA